jgi:hypothetical protein
MAKSLTRQPFGKPSHRVLELNETSDQVARLSEAGYSYKTKRRELEHQFDVKASKLREEYIAEVLEIHTADGRIRTTVLDLSWWACARGEHQPPAFVEGPAGRGDSHGLILEGLAAKKSVSDKLAHVIPLKFAFQLS